MAEKKRITNQTVHNPQLLRKLLEAISTELAQLRTLANELKTDLSEHTHGGVTTGAGTSSAGAAIAAASITEEITHGS